MGRGCVLSRGCGVIRYCCDREYFCKIFEIEMLITTHKPQLSFKYFLYSQIIFKIIIGPYSICQGESSRHEWLLHDFSTHLRYRIRPIKRTVLNERTPSQFFVDFGGPASAKDCLLMLNFYCFSRTKRYIDGDRNCHLSATSCYGT